MQRDARLWPHGPLADAVLPPPRLSGDEGVAEAMLKYGAMSFVEDALAQRAKLTKSRHASQGVRHKHPHKPRPAPPSPGSRPPPSACSDHVPLRCRTRHCERRARMMRAE